MTSPPPLHPVPSRPLHLVLFTAFGLQCGCLPDEGFFDVPDSGPSDAAPQADSSRPEDASSSELSIDGVAVEDWTGETWPLEAMPKRPRLRLSASRPLLPTEDTFLLIEGSVDEEILADLQTPPTRAATRARAVTSTLAGDAAGLLMDVEKRLTSGGVYTLLAAAWATDGEKTLGAPFALALRVTEGDGGATVIATWPADGSSGTPTGLTLAALQLDGAIGAGSLDSSVLLESDDGRPIARQLREVACETIGWASGHCIALIPAETLALGTTYRLRVTEALLDSTGVPLGPFAASFTTTSTTYLSPALLETSCYVDELALSGACLYATDRSVALRAQATGGLRAFLQGGLITSGVFPRGEIFLMVDGLMPATPFNASLRLVDLEGTADESAITVETVVPLPPIALTEVRADALGTEPRQEYVEILNQGSSDLDLQGFAVTDAADKEGDLITQPTPLPAGARALIVADAFDPNDAADVRVPPGIILIRIGTSIGSSGLSNAGEPVWIRDPSGRRITGAPAAASVGGGVCLVRIADDPRRFDREAFAWDPNSTCTPGQ